MLDRQNTIEGEKKETWKSSIIEHYNKISRQTNLKLGSRT